MKMEEEEVVIPQDKKKERSYDLSFLIMEEGTQIIMMIKICYEESNLN